MGEIADDFIDGSCCSLCGMYFQDKDDVQSVFTHGYPVACKECWKELKPYERKGLQKAIAETIL